MVNCGQFVKCIGDIVSVLKYVAGGECRRHASEIRRSVTYRQEGEEYPANNRRKNG
jgi:hypothetical protein